MAKVVESKKSIALNRRARFDYTFGETWEAGLVLTGTEVKSLRDGKCTLGEGYVYVKQGEAWLANVHIPEYTHGNRENHDPIRPRKLLLHAREIEDVQVGTQRQGFTAIPIELYFKDGRVKLLFGLARGKKDFDKRQDEREKTARKEMDRYQSRR